MPATLNPERLEFEFIAGSDKPRVDEFLAKELPRISLTRVRRLISDGDVIVNGATSLKGSRLQSGDIVFVKIFAADKSSATPEAIPLDILYEDEHLIVINKPIGLLVHPSNTEKSGTLTNALAYHFWEKYGEPIRPGLVHRLDRNTSGVIVIAKTLKSLRTLSKHFRERWVKKCYTAIVTGIVATDHGEIDAPIGSDPDKWPHWCVMEEGRSAKTLYKVIRRFHSHTPSYTMLELEPLTGRTHQLRIHCKLIGHPIVGDSIYGDEVGKLDALAAEKKLKHHLLHASKLIFRHPATNIEMTMEAPLPAIFTSITNESGS